MVPKLLILHGNGRCKPVSGPLPCWARRGLAAWQIGQRAGRRAAVPAGGARCARRRGQTDWCLPVEAASQLGLFAEGGMSEGVVGQPCPSSLPPLPLRPL